MHLRPGYLMAEKCFLYEENDWARFTQTFHSLYDLLEKKPFTKAAAADPKTFIDPILPHIESTLIQMLMTDEIEIKRSLK